MAILSRHRDNNNNDDDTDHYQILYELINNKDTIDHFELLDKLIYHNEFELFQILINSGYNIHAKNKYNETLAFKYFDNIPILNLLFNCGFDINLKDKLKYSLLCRNKNNINIAEFLINKNINIEYSTFLDLSALQVSICENNDSLSILLINKGANINYINSSGFSILHYAINLINFKLTKILLEHKDINFDKNYLEFAITSYLINYNTNYDFKLNKDDDSKNNCLKIINLLIEYFTIDDIFCGTYEDHNDMHYSIMKLLINNKSKISESYYNKIYKLFLSYKI